MWRCENCRKENRDERADCWNCSMPKEMSLANDHNTQNSESTNVEKPAVCVQCSASLDEDSKFCPRCAAPILSDSMVNCPKCRKTVDASAKFCKFCAAEIIPRRESNFYSSETLSRTSLSSDSIQADAEHMILGGGGLAAISALAFFWGVSYTGNVANQARAGFGSMIGQTDNTYSLAQGCVVLGAIGFVVGVGLLILGMSQRSKR